MTTIVYLLTILLVDIHFVSPFTKYGRTCKDIGCLSTEQCVMETDPCSYYQREGECGSYPTCKKVGNTGGPSCETYVCPPTKICKMDGATPKCVDDHGVKGHVGYDTHQTNPSAPELYPQIPHGETTPRPNVYRPPNAGGGGYQGGQIGSGYPGNAPAGGGYRPQYPQQPGGYNPQYPQQSGGYNPQYPQSGGYYPQQGGYNGQYPGGQQGGYYLQYPQNGGYRPQNNRYGQNSGSNPLVDKITDTLKNYGLFYLLSLYGIHLVLHPF